MLREEIAKAFRAAKAETLARIRREWEGYPETFAPLLAYLEKHLFDPGFSIEEARRLTRVEHDPPLGRPLKSFLDDQRIRTTVDILERGAGRIPTGRAAQAVGIPCYLTYRRTYERCRGEAPALVCFPDQIDPRFDNLTWHRACQGTLAEAGRALGRRLCRLYPGAFAGGAPRAVLLPVGEPAPKRGYGISEAEAQAALSRASREPLKRLDYDDEELPPDLVRILKALAKRLYEPKLTITSLCEKAGVRDTSITTKALFFTGETLAEAMEKRRVETVVTLLGDQRFTIDRISEEVGMSYRSFGRCFTLRTGTRPSRVRKTLRRTSGHTAYRLWCRTESGKLSPTEARQLGGHLRALCPEALEDLEPQPLAVRTDVDPRRVVEVIQLSGAVERQARATLDGVLKTHPDYSAAHWYSHWIRARLGHRTLDAAWTAWQAADRELQALLELPAPLRTERVREDPVYQSDAFFWLLVDCASVRLFQDAAESEHFVDLALAAAETRCQRERRPEPEGLRGLALALKGNSIRRRGDLTEAARRFEQAQVAIQAGVEPWLEGRIHSLLGQLLYQQGNSRQARQSLSLAVALLKKAGDGLERLRVVIARAPTWCAAGKDPSRLLTLCIHKLRQYPFSSDLLQSAHLTRLLARLYLADQLTGRYLGQLRKLRAEIPPTNSPFFVANHQQIDGLITALGGEPATGGRILKKTAQWFEEHEQLSHAAICWLQYSWAVLKVNGENARQAALIAYEYMAQTGFNSDEQKRLAKQLFYEAQRRCLNRETVRIGLLLRVCPRIKSRLA